MAFKNPTQLEINEYLTNAQTVAIVGLSNKPERTSYQIAAFLQEKGYQIIPVNPVLVGETILGEKVVAQLEDIAVPIDIVDIFRKSEFLPAIAQSFLKIDAAVFWAQLGIENEEAAEILATGKKQKVVMNRCIKIEWNKNKQI